MGEQQHDGLTPEERELLGLNWQTRSLDDPHLTTEELNQLFEQEVLRAQEEANGFNQELWEQKGKILAFNDSQNRWELGKWLNDGLKGMPDFFIQTGIDTGIDLWGHAAALTGLKASHLKDLASTERRVKPSVRTDRLFWSHHRVLINELPVAADDELKAWLQKAVDEDLTVKQFERVLKGHKQQGKIKPTVTHHVFECTVPIETWRVLRDLGNGDGQKGPEKYAANILVEYCSTEGTEINRKIAREEAAQRAHEARSRNGHRVAQIYNPLKLDR